MELTIFLTNGVKVIVDRDADEYTQFELYEELKGEKDIEFSVSELGATYYIPRERISWFMIQEVKEEE